MAHGTACKMRMYHVNDMHPMLRTLPIYEKLKAMDINKNLSLIEIAYTAALTAANFTQLSIPNAVFDGSAAAKHCWVVSASADDTDASNKDCRAVKVLGLTASGLQYDTIRMAGATNVEGAKLFYWIFHGHCSEWGSAGSDAKGNITIYDGNPAGGGVACLQIAAGANESEGMAFWLPDDYLVNLANYKIMDLISTAATENAQVRISYVNVDGDGADPDLQYDIYRISHSPGYLEGSEVKIREVTTSYCKVDTYACYITTATTAYIRLLFIVAGMSPTLRGVS